MAKNNSWAPFTFLWTIENFHAFPSPDAICSPSFVINCMEKTEWKLRLDTYKDGDKLDDWVRCYLSRQKEDDGPKSIVVEFKISLLASDQSLLITRRQKQKFTKGGASEIQYFIKLQQVFIERRDQFLPNDTLTVQCKMWRTGTNISTSTLCSARSCLLKECNPFTWGVEQFNPFDIEQERKRTSCLKENTLILTLFLRKDRNETYVCIRGEIENCNGRRKGIGGEVSVLNKMGKVYVSRYSDGVFTSSETEFDLITVSELLKYRSSLLPNNMLTLRCGFEIACKEPESCDGTSKEVSKIVTKNEDLLEVQDELVFCCPLKKDLKYLYESKSDSDIELQAGDKTFQAHKNILSVRCPMLRRRLEDENTERLDLGSINANILERLLLYIYTDTVEDLDLNSGVSLYKVAKEFELPSLTKKCVSMLNLSLSEKDEILAFLVNSDQEWNSRM